ncbi:hypothetical protein SG34_023625 [Thalassomonas viridans]|uniref:Uncharacterized protein n=1 Tax=Thalassomonas viridans TaxID=137584 RepID=A0AAE9Z007_9GAMM|nr:hypothetical protein [Thalassomonas viridans]WDE04301.1 hypothetical protein SG34_023625 [Thalassomonas viridans]
MANIAILSHPCDHGISLILSIAIPSHPCDHGIPLILSIKKAGAKPAPAFYV